MEHYTALIAGLGHVILGILNGQRHLPFKESKVTQLLREVLGSVSCQVGGGTILAKNIIPTEFQFQAILLETSLLYVQQKACPLAHVPIIIIKSRCHITSCGCHKNMS